MTKSLEILHKINEWLCLHLTNILQKRAIKMSVFCQNLWIISPFLDEFRANSKLPLHHSIETT